MTSEIERRLSSTLRGGRNKRMTRAGQSVGMLLKLCPRVLDEGKERRKEKKRRRRNWW